MKRRLASKRQPAAEAVLACFSSKCFEASGDARPKLQLGKSEARSAQWLGELQRLLSGAVLALERSGPLRH